MSSLIELPKNGCILSVAEEEGYNLLEKILFSLLWILSLILRVGIERVRSPYLDFPL
jgi:hypothetical protein